MLFRTSAILARHSSRTQTAAALRHLSRSSTNIMTIPCGPVQKSIQDKLQDALTPAHLQIINESSSHNVPKGSETHFKVVAISALFEGKGLLARHRLINGILKEELDTGVHALSIVAKTASEWEKVQGAVPASPACRGGSKK
ncbi:cell division protein [Nannochloropsis oceanica]